MRNITLATALAGGMITAAAMLPATAQAALISIGATTTLGGAITTFATDSGSGFASASGGLGTFTLASATATGSPILAQPTLDTSSIDVSSSAAGTLYVFVTQQGLTTPLGVSNFLSTFTFQAFQGAITSVVEKTFVSASNQLYTGTALASATNTTGALMTSGIIASTPLLTGPYSETVEYIITATGAGSTNDTININSVTTVPEPASLTLLGLGMVAVGAIRRRRRG